MFTIQPQLFQEHIPFHSEPSEMASEKKSLYRDFQLIFPDFLLYVPNANWGSHTECFRIGNGLWDLMYTVSGNRRGQKPES